MYEVKSMVPIKLTQYGETLREYPHASTSFVKPKVEPDDEKLSCCIGIHDVCDCWMDIKAVSSTHNAIVCRGCGLRVVIPNWVNTFGDLRKFCTGKLKRRQ